MKEKELKENKNSKISEILMIIFMALSMILGWYYINNEFIKKSDIKCKSDDSKADIVQPTPVSKPNLMSEQEAIRIGEELYKYTVDVLFNGEKINVSTDNSDYISGNSDKCNKGTGCYKITNWEDISSKFTQNLINSLDYNSTGKFFRKYSLVVMIDKVAYKYDMSTNRKLKEINSFIVSDNEENKIVFTIESEKEKEVGEELHNECAIDIEHFRSTDIMTIVKENDTWKVDSFESQGSILLNGCYD